MRARRAASCLKAFVLASAAVAFVAGCDDQGSGVDPSEADALGLTKEKSRIQVTEETEFGAAYRSGRRDETECDWYVDGVLGGSAQSGHITQTNPATYTAPGAVPAGGTVEIRAVDHSDTNSWAADTLTIANTMRFVDADDGSDAHDGSWAAPWKTLTHALGEIAAPDTVFLWPGHYDQANGEDASFTVPDSVTVAGAHAESCFVTGDGSESHTVTLEDGGTIQNVTVGTDGTDPNIGIFVGGPGTIRGVRIHDAYDYSAIRLRGSACDALAEDCVITNTETPGTDRGFELVFGTVCTVRNCTISGWGRGIFANTDSEPLVENCTITGNVDGVQVWGGDSGQITLIDLGGGSRDGQGGNVIQGNTEAGIVNRMDADVWAVYNTWDNDPPTVGPPYPCDMENEGTGSIIWQ
ncbi:MAG: DUF1565 domain-containing protein [Candidatus Eisenbacteria bacterium]|nr:DUF1565 domain-containing protein [Candidatus Eisenbacteria bacterium]